MRKHFLILMLLALLPLAGWAESANLLTSPALASGLIYKNNTAQTLLTGEATLPPNYQITPGCVLYQVTSTEVSPDLPAAELVGVATTEFPTATSAGKYYVWYQVKADGVDYLDDAAWKLVDPTYKYVRISSATPTITDPTSAGRTYNGDYQSLLAQPGSTTFGTLKYRLNGEGDWIEWSDENFATTIKGKNAGNYTVNLMVEAEDGSETPDWVGATKDVTVNIAKKTLSGEGVTIALKNNFVNPIFNPTTPSTITVEDIVVTWNGEPLTGGTDFQIDADAYENNYAAGTAICKLKSGTNNNFTGGSVDFTIDPKPITAGMFTIADVTYTGLPITQTDLTGAAGFVAKDDATNLVAKVGNAEGDYTLTTDAKNATTEDGSKVTIQGVGNYTGTLENVGFDVTKAVLTVNATDVTVACLTTVTDEVLAGHYEITGWKGDDEVAETKPEVSGAPVIANTGSTAAVGPQENAISISNVGTLSTANYTFATGAKASLIVEAIPLTIAFKDNIGTFYYKDKVPAFSTMGDAAIKANYLTVSKPEAVTDIEIKVYNSQDAEVAEGAELTVGSTYTLKVTDKHINVCYLLTGEIADKTITVQPLPITIVAKDQAIAYNKGESAGPALAMDTDTNADSENDTWNTNVQIKIGDEVQDMDAFRTKYGVWTEDFIKELTWSKAEDYSIAEPGSIGITLKEDYDDDNFAVDPKSGKVTWNDVETTITLARTDAGAENLIKEYDGAKGITVKFASRKLKKEQWYALVLPFPTSVTELSSKLGYAVVNIIKNENTDPSKMQFKLHMGDIAANQPFLVKVYNDAADDKGKDLADASVTFTDKTITYSAEPKDIDEAGNQLIGVYKTTNLEANENLWIINGGNFNKLAAPATLKPIVAYLKTATVHDSFAPSIFVEDIDGTVTAINSINADGVAVPAEGWYTINGVKLQGAPTEKGIYIQNGKKVVLK